MARPRVLLYSHDGLGLGHVQRTLALAGELGRRRPDATLLIVGSSPRANDLAVGCPPNVTLVKLPMIRQGRLYVGLPAWVDDPRQGPAGAAGQRRGGSLNGFRQAVLEATAHAFSPHLVYVDHTPTGFSGELNTLFRAWRVAARRPRLALGMRDIFDDRERTARAWARTAALTAMERDYDRIMIFGDRRVFDPIAAYDLPPTVAAKCVWCGYVARSPSPAADTAHPRRETGSPLVVVTTGSGSDGAAVHRAFLAAVNGGLLPGVSAVVVAGPLLPEPDLTELRALAHGAPGIELVPFVPDLPVLLRTADAVVTMAGYNTSVELLAAGKRPIFVPRVWPSGEQLLRAERLTVLGLATYLHPDDLTPEGLAAAILAELAAGVSPAPFLDMDGLRRGGDELEALLDDR